MLQFQEEVGAHRMTQNALKVAEEEFEQLKKSECEEPMSRFGSHVKSVRSIL